MRVGIARFHSGFNLFGALGASRVELHVGAEAFLGSARLGVRHGWCAVGWFGHVGVPVDDAALRGRGTVLRDGRRLSDRTPSVAMISVSPG